jgi:hypothetical protein
VVLAGTGRRARRGTRTNRVAGDGSLRNARRKGQGGPGATATAPRVPLPQSDRQPGERKVARQRRSTDPPRRVFRTGPSFSMKGAQPLPLRNSCALFVDAEHLRFSLCGYRLPACGARHRDVDELVVRVAYTLPPHASPSALTGNGRRLSRSRDLAERRRLRSLDSAAAEQRRHGPAEEQRRQFGEGEERLASCG